MAFDLLRRPTSADRLGTGTMLALVVHVGLVLALAWGVSWRQHDASPVSAELWSAVPTVADAPAPPPPPPAPATPAPRPAPPKPVVEPKPAPMPAKDAEIATEKKPKKKEEPKKEEPKKEEPKKAEVKKPDPKPVPDKKAEDKQKAAEQAARDKTDAARAQQMRQEQMQRLNAQLLGAGAAAGTGGGTAAQSAGPSASYQGRVVARIRPNIIFNGQVAGHPKAEVSIRVAPDGTIVSKRLTRPSGIPEWDEAVLRAIDRTEVLPRDVDGRVPSEMVIGFDPNER